MTKEQANKIVEDNNAAIDNYMKNILPVELAKAGYPVIDGKIPVIAWFTAQSIISKAGLYANSVATLHRLRNAGFDVKINMQDNKLTRA